MTRRVARPETRMEKEGEEEEEGRIWRNKVRIIEAIERSRGRWAAKWIPPSNGGWKKKRAHAHTHIHTYTHIYTRRVYVVFGETATPRVCSKSDNVALERRFVNTLEKMRGGGWFFLSLFLGIRKSIYLLRIAPLEELGVLPSTAERLSRPGSGPGCFERLLIAATRLSWCVVTILRVTGRLRFLEKLVESEWNGFCCREGKGMFVRIFFPGNKMIIIEKRLINNLALDF